MKTVTLVLSAIVITAAGTSVNAQGAADRAFTATGSSCDQITWTQASLSKYPRIVSACQAVLEKDGNTRGS
jgi:hypothetical protein